MAPRDTVTGAGVMPLLDASQWDSYPLEPEELEFLAAQTGIDDEQALKEHVLTIRAKAYEVHKFPCIRSFSFARSNRIMRLPGYGQIRPIVETQSNAIMLDLGCCFGTETRKIVSQGFPVNNIIGTDLHQEFWDLGKELFTVPFPAAFIAGDILDPTFFTPATPLPTSLSPPLPPPPPLSGLVSLTPLNGQISILYSAHVFHLFDKAKQAHLAHLMAGLLSPLPGSMIFGTLIAKLAPG